MIFDKGIIQRHLLTMKKFDIGQNSKYMNEFKYKQKTAKIL